MTERAKFTVTIHGYGLNGRNYVFTHGKFRDAIRKFRHYASVKYNVELHRVSDGVCLAQNKELQDKAEQRATVLMGGLPETPHTFHVEGAGMSLSDVSGGVDGILYVNGIKTAEFVECYNVDNGNRWDVIDEKGFKLFVGLCAFHWCSQRND